MDYRIVPGRFPFKLNRKALQLSEVVVSSNGKPLATPASAGPGFFPENASRVVAVALAMFTAGACGIAAQAQAPKVAPKVAPKSAPNQPEQQPTTQPPQQPPAATPGAPVQQPAYSAWTKFCDRVPGNSNQQACFTTQYGQYSNGATVVVATLIEAEGRKALRITLPLGVQLRQGMRAVIDQGQPMNTPYRVCSSNGCAAEFEASDELIGKLKTGQTLTVQGIDYQGYELNFSLPLLGFAKAYDGAPVDAQAERRLQEDLQKRAEEARKRLQAQPPDKK
jgi:invasion protein IalB